MLALSAGREVRLARGLLAAARSNPVAGTYSLFLVSFNDLTFQNHDISLPSGFIGIDSINASTTRLLKCNFGVGPKW